MQFDYRVWRAGKVEADGGAAGVDDDTLGASDIWRATRTSKAAQRPL